MSFSSVTRRSPRLSRQISAELRGAAAVQSADAVFPAACPPPGERVLGNPDAEGQVLRREAARDHPLHRLGKELTHVLPVAAHQHLGHAKGIDVRMSTRPVGP